MPARCGARRDPIWSATPRNCARRPVGDPPAPSTICCETSSMPKRTDLARILLLGSGPIVIGQAAEFDYSGTQAVKALKEEGYTVILVNSNPATIMTDPELADRTSIEPVSRPYLEQIIRNERPHAMLSTVGVHTSLNLSVDGAEAGGLQTYRDDLLHDKHDDNKKL